MRPGGDIAAIAGLCKHLLVVDAVDHEFIAGHCHAFAEFADQMHALSGTR